MTKTIKERFEEFLAPYKDTVPEKDAKRMFDIAVLGATLAFEFVRDEIDAGLKKAEAESDDMSKTAALLEAFPAAVAALGEQLQLEASSIKKNSDGPEESAGDQQGVQGA